MTANPRNPRRAVSLVETVVALFVVLTLLAILLPMLRHARLAARRDLCAMHQYSIGVGWLHCLRETGGFPATPDPAGWKYAGVTFSRMSGNPRLDFQRPINRWLATAWKRSDGSTIFESPVDTGMIAPDGDEPDLASVYRARGTSYRANAALLDARKCHLDTVRRPLRAGEVTTAPEQLVVLGAPFWYETLRDTGRVADWYGEPSKGVVLFLDGSTRMISVQPNTPVTAEYSFEPVRPESVPPRVQNESGTADSSAQ